MTAFRAFLGAAPTAVLAALILSCATAPAASPSSVPAAAPPALPAPAEENPVGGEAQESEPASGVPEPAAGADSAAPEKPEADHPASVVVPPVAEIPLIEPESPIPESFAPPQSPQAEQDGIVLSEPMPPALPPPAAPESIPSPASPPVSAPLPATVTAAAPKTAATPAPAAKPAPVVQKAVEKKAPVTNPPPVETVPPPAIVREAVPVPAAALPELPARSAPVAVEEPAAFSRTVRATVGQLVEIPFRGAGWIFLGEQGARKGLPYDSRRLDAEGQSFMFRAEAAGTFDLKFYRQDFVEDYVINDRVRVTVVEPDAGSAVGGFSLPLDRSRVVAEPRWPLLPVAKTGATALSTATTSTVPKAAALIAAASAAAASAPASVPAAIAAASPATSAAASVPAAAASAVTPAAMAPTAMSTATRPADTGIAREAIPAAAAAAAAAPVAATPAAAAAAAAFSETLKSLGTGAADPAAFLALARTESEAGRTANALLALDSFSQAFPSGSDEAWWLYGRLLEANGPNKDVKASLDYYRRLVAEYPQSSRYDEARKRIAYLERYYFEIR